MKFSPSTGGKLPEEKTLDRFAWHSYLLYGRMVPLTLPAMRNRYAAAIKSLQKGANEVEETDRTLASHLIWFYAHSAIEIDDPLLVHFFTLASAALRAQAIGDIGWSIGQDDAALMPAIQERLMRLLEHRLSLLKEAPREEGRESRDLRLVAQLWEVSRGMGRGPGNANLGKTALLEPGFRSRENVRIIGEQVSI
jgi:hypothetical protein